ncbi:histone deacetylase [Streptomyces sp. NBC_00691]|uniref:histone deacetylase n=1 Tax=Streptomyces sp. NBC_00691 TaxID=2903671 RepID=UPI002E3549ED|nr:histone deacetylase [Streptomyces sp. NBC_00691]
MTEPRPRVWYAAYGSNMHAERLRRYLAGGRPDPGARELPGCRDPRGPDRSVPVELDGQVYFAAESAVWTGGLAFYDPDTDGTAWGVAHLLTAGQFSDIAAQEMYRRPGTDLDLAEVLATGRCEVGPGRYETLVCPGHIDRIPVLTFTAPWPMPPADGLRPPSAAYLRHLAAGLHEAGAWRPAAVADYLASRPGAAGHWTPEDVAAAGVP